MFAGADVSPIGMVQSVSVVYFISFVPNRTVPAGITNSDVKADGIVNVTVPFADAPCIHGNCTNGCKPIRSNQALFAVSMKQFLSISFSFCIK